MPAGPNRELELLWKRPLVQGLLAGKLTILAGGLSIEDVLLELHAFGDVVVQSIPSERNLQGRPWPRYRCSVRLRGQDGGQAMAFGQTATAAALRCLTECLEEFDA